MAVRSVDHLQDLIDRLMPYAETVTSIVLSSVVTHRVIEPAVETPAARTRSRGRRDGDGPARLG